MTEFPPVTLTLKPSLYLSNGDWQEIVFGGCLAYVDVRESGHFRIHLVRQPSNLPVDEVTWSKLISHETMHLALDRIGEHGASQQLDLKAHSPRFNTPAGIWYGPFTTPKESA
jgi:hypothetical protein